jgi:hypothetical protein
MPDPIRHPVPREPWIADVETPDPIRGRNDKSGVRNDTQGPRMNSICITGAVPADLLSVASILQQAGMAPARAAKREEPVDMAFWHEQVMGLNGQQAEAAQTIPGVGKLWEQLAGNIFMANLDAPLWGWMDTRSTWLLDYWLGFEPALKFILVCVSPQQMLAAAMSTQTQTVSVAELMATWQAHHQALLRFAQRQPQRCLLVDVSECAGYPQGLIERCVAKWKLPLAEPAASFDAPAEQDQLVLYLAQQLCGEHPQTATLQRELAGAITRLRTTAIALSVPTTLSKLGARISRLGRAEKPLPVYAPPSEQIIANFQALRDRSAKLWHTQEQVATLTDACDHQARLAADKQAEISAVSKERDSHARQAAERQKQLDALAKDKGALEQEKAALTKARDEQTKLAAERQAKIDATTKERDSHAHQAAERQKQLDALTKEKGALEQEKATLTKTKDEQTKLAAERQAKIDAVSKERDSHAHQAAERQKQIEVLNQSKGALEQEKVALTKARDEQTKLAVERQVKIDAVSKERDSHAQQAIERQAKIDALTKQLEVPARGDKERRKDAAAHAKEKAAWEQEKAALTKARDEQAKLAAERQTKLDALGKVQTKCQEAEQEGELLLLQLHQVQEELEHYFLQNQELEQKLKANSTRWQRMLQRNPDYTDYESIELIEAPAGDNELAHWRLANIDAAGRTFAALEFQTFVLSGVAGFTFTRDEQGGSPLLHWPASSSASNVYQIPLGRQATLEERIEGFFELSSSDWRLMQKLPRVLTGILEQPDAVKASGDFNALPLRLGLDKLGQIIDKFPHSLRFDGLKLKSEQVNRDYEHLWLSFENLSLGDKAYAEFEFRLSCANVHTDGFGKHPKLEFPEGAGQAPLQNWFADSYDDFGAKLELRLALPEAMDMEVWQKFSTADHKFLIALVMRLPAILLALQSAGMQAKRSWDDWQAMVVELQRIVMLHTAPQPKASPATPLAEQAAAQPSPKAKTRKTKAAA